MPPNYAYQQVKSATGFDYDNLSNPDFLSNLRYVRSTRNSRVVYEVRFPNTSILHEDSLIVSLNKEGGLICYEKTEYYDGLVVVEILEVTELIPRFPFMSSYSKFVVSCFLSCSTYFI